MQEQKTQVINVQRQDIGSETPLQKFVVVILYGLESVRQKWAALMKRMGVVAPAVSKQNQRYCRWRRLGPMGRKNCSLQMKYSWRQMNKTEMSRGMRSQKVGQVLEIVSDNGNQNYHNMRVTYQANQSQRHLRPNDRTDSDKKSADPPKHCLDCWGLGRLSSGLCQWPP